MRFSTIASVALAAPSAVQAMGMMGFALGTKKADGTCKYTADYESDFDAIYKATGSKLVRGYDADDCNCAQQILPAAKAKGFQVVLGIWPDLPSTFNAGISAIKAHMPGYEKQVYAITVGSETLYRHNFTGPQLLGKINQVKGMFPTARVGTADSYNKFADGTGDALLHGGVDLIMANAFSYWQGQTRANMTHSYFDDIMRAFSHIQSINKNIELWNGETGWPTTGGTNYQAAQASTAWAKEYFDKAVCGMLDWDVNVFYFEAFDEPWKPVSIGDNGDASDETHWGAMTADRAPKFSLRC